MLPAKDGLGALDAYWDCGCQGRVVHVALCDTWFAKTTYILDYHVRTVPLFTLCVVSCYLIYVHAESGVPNGTWSIVTSVDHETLGYPGFIMGPRQ